MNDRSHDDSYTSACASAFKRTLQARLSDPELIMPPFATAAGSSVENKRGMLALADLVRGRDLKVDSVSAAVPAATLPLMPLPLLLLSPPPRCSTAADF